MPSSPTRACSCCSTPTTYTRFDRGVPQQPRRFYASAGEDDDGGENARVSALNLDATAFPNATALKTNAQIGRLTVSNIDGDVDGDHLQVLGSRSFAIWDRYGNLVFDSGDSIERLIARLNPADFNADNEANQGHDSRSDNKGPEPETLAVG